MKKIITFVLAASLSLSLFGLDIFNYVQINGTVKNYRKSATARAATAS